MTLIWDTLIDKGWAAVYTMGKANQRSLCWNETDTTYIAIYIRDSAGIKLLCYGWGDDNLWNEELLVRSDAATGRLGIQLTVESGSMDIDQINNHIHITFEAGGRIYHAECIVPTAPNNNANWTSWAGNRYQLVDNNTAPIAQYNPSISVDGAGNPHIVYGWSGAEERVYYNYGNGAGHAFTPASEISFNTGASSTSEAFPVIVAITDEVRDLYVIWNEGTAVKYRFCDNLNNPLVLVNWTATATVNSHANQVIGISAYYWYDGGAAKTQLMMASIDSNNIILTNWYDEGNVNGWGGGWKSDPNGDPAPNGDAMRLAQVDANDFILVRITNGGGPLLFSFTDYGNTVFTFGASTVYTATNLDAIDLGVECRGREHDNFSVGTMHTQGTGLNGPNVMFNLMRVNAKPTTGNYVPDNGARVNEAAAITLDYDFTDPGQAQTKRRVQVDLYGGDFSSPVYDSGEQAGAGSSWDVPGATLAFNTHYEWRVKVWDNEVGDEYDPYSEGDWGS